MAEVDGFGTTLGYAAGVYTTAATFTLLAKISEIDPQDESVQKVPTRVMTTPSKVETYQPGWKEPGKIKCTIHFAKALISTIETTLFGVTVGYQVTYSDGSTHQGDGYIDKKQFKTPIDNLAVCEIEIQTTGPWTFTPAP